MVLVCQHAELEVVRGAASERSVHVRFRVLALEIFAWGARARGGGGGHAATRNNKITKEISRGGGVTALQYIKPENNGTFCIVLMRNGFVFVSFLLLHRSVMGVAIHTINTRPAFLLRKVSCHGTNG